MSKRILCALLSTLISCLFGYSNAFQSFQFPNIFKPPSPPASNRKQGEQNLLDAVSNTQNGKLATPAQQRNILNLVAKIEQDYPSPSLSDIVTNQPDLIDGVWFLQYTSPSDIETLIESDDGENDDNTVGNQWEVENAEDKITIKKANIQGGVSAAGINVDVSSKTPRQVFNLEKSTVMNEVILDNGLVRVGGPFRLSDKKENRAVIAFDEGTVQLNDVFLLGDFKLDLSPIFGLRSIVTGNKEAGWLETTYLSEDVRIGRGNKGTCFVLTRDAGAVVP